MKITCPECYGNGYIPICWMVDEIQDISWSECDACSGTGLVEVASDKGV